MSESILRKPKSAFDKLGGNCAAEADSYAAGYKAFLDAGKTERECVSEAARQARENGFTEFQKGSNSNKIYVSRHGKAIMFIRRGKKPLSEGFRMVAAHIDSPRIDLKAYPLYEQDGFAMLKTHYYGGIKKYQWMAVPLELRGAVCLASGKKVDVAPEAGEPVLFISDILPHLGAEQAKKPISEAFPGEGLNVTAGLLPEGDEKEDRVKLAVMTILNKRYGMVEDDFQSAELSLVPAGGANDAGLDRSMMGAYGQDDRACSYAALRALFDAREPEYTGVCILADKEEIGSEGITGMQSAFFDQVLEDLCEAEGCTLRDAYSNSFCFSGDVCNAFDPNFESVSDKRNNARLGYGPGIFKFTGTRGKAGSSDASAETMSRVRRLLDGAGVCWQMGELGKVDQGGGGTVAKYLANRNIEVVDIGMPVLNMHAPMEITSKIDCWQTYKAFLALYGER
ncbi:MAG: aminopeptidase [Oscillospiraceae bacterium]|jgi:aspartyl aminopeptidase|nr:aminopeptidase [Oscillospiraceae bacterium]